MAASFRVRIALLSTVLSGAVLLVFGIFFLSVIHRMGIARIDRELLAIGESLLKLRPFHRGAQVGFDLERSRRFIYGPGNDHRFVLRVRDATGAISFQSPDWPAALDESGMPAPEVRDPLPPGSAPPPPELLDSGRWVPPKPVRSSFATLRDGGATWRVALLVHPGGKVTLAQDLAAFAAENAGYRNAFLLAAPLALLLLATAGSWVASRALRPIEAITATAKSITSRGLGERVPAVRADREIAQLIGVINGMLERLERSFQQAARFSADAAHELKTPLTVLQGQLEQALQEAPDGSPAQRAMSDLLGEVQRLRSIVRKLLLLAQADAGRLGGGGEIIDWSGRVEELVADLREMAPDLALRADVAPGVEVRGDQDLLVQLLQNLGGNAVKFHRPGPAGEPGGIEVELRLEGGRAVFRIANTGPPLSPEEKERVFERFYRGDPSRNRRVDGVGLGLSLAQEIAHAHGGDLKVDTDRPGWVRFTLELAAL